MIHWLMAIIIASSSAFFVFSQKTVEVDALVCMTLGEYPLHRNGDVDCKDPTSSDNIKEQVTGIQTYVVGFLKVLMSVGAMIIFMGINYSGYLYVTSEGDPIRLKSAKTWMRRSFVGMFLLMSTFTIMNLLTVISGLKIVGS